MTKKVCKNVYVAQFALKSKKKIFYRVIRHGRRTFTARRLWCPGRVPDWQPPDYFLQDRVPPLHQLRR
ncbi:hypothetical protein ATCV1_z281L [Acanthocystis turfacea chlorella virus 1]|uniref:Uncharacterized protein z281L n=1 Tax=Chlorovirus heliozoae TaxID=322019 RepID=A7K8P1_9PHYC|nr:hypothetical protein ATCV1_z281L [Acanthocystis turfacea chlorella virus 1]ABT16415.1 hypothetical protein ATCV1_z281L [Acanthocystis turfacea chlorella virus 1]